MSRREEWRPVLEAEVKRWSAKTTEQLIEELHEVHAYQLTFGSKEYNVEVQLLENTAKYIHVMVAVDDGTLPASFRALTDSFVRQK